ncbi:MAG: DUF5713 family protein [Pirellulaceae bacterium]
MNKNNNAPNLPQYLSCFESQDLAFRIRVEGEGLLRRTLEDRRESNSRSQLIGAEMVSASIGHPIETKYWSFFAEDWLSTSGFIADEPLVALAIDVAKQSQDLNPSDADAIANLIVRLSSPVKRLKRRTPEISAQVLRKIVRTFEDNIFADGALYGRLPTTEQAIAVGYFRNLRELAVGFPFNADDSALESFKILLLYGRSSLKSMTVTAQNDPNHLLLNCTEMLDKLSILGFFEAQDMRVNDDVVRAVCSGRALWGFRSISECESYVTSKGIDCLLQCDNLVMVDIKSRFLTIDDGNRLLTRFPELNLMSVPHDSQLSEYKEIALGGVERQPNKSDSESEITDDDQRLRHDFFVDLLEDDYYPPHLVEKLKNIFHDLCHAIESQKPDSQSEIKKLFDQSVDRINDLVADFQNSNSDIDTDAREAIVDEFVAVLDSYSLEYDDIEQLLSNRSW